MFFFLIVFLVLVIIRPQEYPGMVGVVVVPLLPVVLAGATLFWLFSARKSLTPPQYPLLLAFMVALMLSRVMNGWLGGAIMVLSNFGLILVSFVLLANGIDTRRRIVTAMAVLSLCAFVLALHGIDQARTGIGWTGATLSQGTRIQYIGIFNDPNDLGLLFAMCLPMSVYLGARGGLGGLRRLFWWSIAATLLYGVYLTDSRGTLLAVVGVVGVHIWLRRGPVAAGFVAALALGAALLLPSRLQDMDVSETSAMGRVESWYHGLQMFLDNPLFGVGAGAYSDLYQLTAHNSFILVLAESGFIGFTIWIAFLGYCVLMPLAVVRRLVPPGQPQDEVVDDVVEVEWSSDRAVSATLLLSFCGFLAASFFLSRSYVVVLYLIAALITAQYTDLRRRYPDLPGFSLGRDLFRWPIWSAVFIAGLYVGVKVLLAMT